MVYNGTKLKDAKNPKATLAYKYRNWRGSKPGRTGMIAFQKKHWSDKDIMMQWFDFILDEVHPEKKVGISLDMAPCQINNEVEQYIKRRYEEGRLVVAYIDGGLTSIIQVCDLDANKPLKIEIRRLSKRSGRRHLISPTGALP